MVMEDEDEEENDSSMRKAIVSSPSRWKAPICCFLPNVRACKLVWQERWVLAEEAESSDHT